MRERAGYQLHGSGRERERQRAPLARHVRAGEHPVGGDVVGAGRPFAEHAQLQRLADVRRFGTLIHSTPALVAHNREQLERLTVTAAAALAVRSGADADDPEPWITATAFLHSVMMQEKKGMMKVWNMVLVSAAFLLSILGTTLTRTGLVASVHAFAQSPVKPYFTSFVVGATVLTALAIIKNLPYLKSEVKLESVVSRESSFLFNNLIRRRVVSGR